MRAKTLFDEAFRKVPSVLVAGHCVYIVPEIDLRRIVDRIVLAACRVADERRTSGLQEG